MAATPAWIKILGIGAIATAGLFTIKTLFTDDDANSNAANVTKAAPYHLYIYLENNNTCMFEYLHPQFANLHIDSVLLLMGCNENGKTHLSHTLFNTPACMNAVPPSLFLEKEQVSPKKAATQQQQQVFQQQQQQQAFCYPSSVSLCFGINFVAISKTKYMAIVECLHVPNMIHLKTEDPFSILFKSIVQVSSGILFITQDLPLTDMCQIQQVHKCKQPHAPIIVLHNYKDSLCEEARHVFSHTFLKIYTRAENNKEDDNMVELMHVPPQQYDDTPLFTSSTLAAFNQATSVPSTAPQPVTQSNASVIGSPKRKTSIFSIFASVEDEEETIMTCFHHANLFMDDPQIVTWHSYTCKEVGQEERAHNFHVRKCISKLIKKNHLAQEQRQQQQPALVLSQIIEQTCRQVMKQNHVDFDVEWKPAQHEQLKVLQFLRIYKSVIL